MADSLSNMKEKLNCNTLAYSSATGILHADKIAPMYSDAIMDSMNLTDSESRNKIYEMVENVMSLKPSTIDKDNDWCTYGEWTEALCWHLFKYPRINHSKWRYWFSNIFDMLDGDHDGYISADHFNMFYLITARKDDTEFLHRAFASVDTSNTGRVSKEQYVDAYMKYMTDPDITYRELPLY